MNKRIILCGAALLIALVAGCSKEEKPAAASQNASSIADTPENRRAMADQVIEAYPAAEWGADIFERVSSQSGSDVAAQARDKIRDAMSTTTIRDSRIKFLTDTFTAAELKILADLYRDTASKDLLRKMPRFEEKVRDAVGPFVMEVLSGKSGPVR